MAKKIAFQVPYVVRHVVHTVGEYLELVDRFIGMPMNIKLVSTADEGQRVTLFFEGGLKIIADIVSTHGRFGQECEIRSLKLRWRDDVAGRTAHTAADLMKWTGTVPIEYKDGDWSSYATVILEGEALQALSLNASHRRNGLPTYEWDDPEHPLHPHN